MLTEGCGDHDLWRSGHVARRAVDGVEDELRGGGGKARDAAAEERRRVVSRLGSETARLVRRRRLSIDGHSTIGEAEKDDAC